MHLKNNDHIEQFLRWAELDRRRSPNTIIRYKATLDQLFDPLGMTVEDIEEWWQTRYHLSAATRANELACLRTFYKWATRFDHRPDDPTRRLDPPPIDNRIPRPIGEADLQDVFDVLRDREELDLYRAAALGAYAGMRISETASLDWSDIDQDRKRIYITGKGRKERVMGLSAVLLDKLLPNTGGNVLTAGGESYRPDTLQRKMNRAFKAAGVDHTFHDLRKRGATLAIEKTGDIYAVSKAWGWSSIETASAYATVSDETLDQIAHSIL